MAKKYQITEKQRDQFNSMRATLIRISKEYQTSNQLRRNGDKMYGLDFEEVIEMSYDNIQSDAAAAVKGVKGIVGEFGI